MPVSSAESSTDGSALVLKLYPSNSDNANFVAVSLTKPLGGEPSFGWETPPQIFSTPGGLNSKSPWAYERVELYDDGDLVLIVQTCPNDSQDAAYIQLWDFKTLILHFRVPCFLAGKHVSLRFEWTFNLRNDGSIRVEWGLPWTLKKPLIGEPKQTFLPYDSLFLFIDKLQSGIALQLTDLSEGAFLSWFNGKWSPASDTESPPKPDSDTNEIWRREVRASLFKLRLPKSWGLGEDVLPVFGFVNPGFLFPSKKVNRSYTLMLAGQPLKKHFWISQLHQRPSDQWLARHFDPVRQMEGAGPILIAALGDASELWNQLVVVYRKSLNQGQHTSSLTFLPEIDTQSDRDTWLLRWNVEFDLSATAAAPVFHLRSIEPDGTGAVHMAHFPFPALSDPQDAVIAGVGFPFFPLDMSSVADNAIFSGDPFSDDNTLRFALGRPENAPAALSGIYRLDTLDLKFGGNLPKDHTFGQRWFVMRGLRELEQPNGAQNARFACDFILPVSSVEPGGAKNFPVSDDEYKYQLPLVFSITPTPAKPSVDYWLQIQEANLPDSPRQVLLNLRGNPRNDVATTDLVGLRQRIVVLDPRPFLVALIDVGGFEATGGGGGNDRPIASFKINPGQDQGFWQLSTSQKREVYLPPAAVGEEMVQGNELESKDINHTPLDFRYGTLTKIKGLDANQNAHFTRAPWDLGSILAFEAGNIVGSNIESLQFELVYGQVCSTSDASPTALRLAEIFTTLGSIAGPYPDRAPKVAVDHWSTFAALYGKRLAVLMPDDSSGLNGGASDPLHVTTLTNMSCSFRPEAREYYRAVDAGVGNEFQHTIDPTGLHGGLTWAFEQPQVLNALIRWQNGGRQGTGIALNPYFSAIGGSGFQKTTYEDGLDLVLSNTEQGRNSFLSVSRLGRISVFGNLARHVVEYERTTVPAHQFENSQPRFANRPVIRKVREFIEILEPKRTLNSDPQKFNCGFLQSIEFKTEKIPVDSSWGANVGDPIDPTAELGWKIPLWRRAPEPTGPRTTYYYDKPHVVMNLAGADADSKSATPPPDVETAIDNPERLFFYTRTSGPDGSLSNPAEWPLISGLDFSPAPSPTATTAAFSGTDVNEVPATEPRVPVGLSAFTYRLLPGSRDINVTANLQGASPYSAVLKNVTVLRTPRAPKLSDAAKTLQAATDGLRNDVFQHVRTETGQLSAVATAVRDKISSLQTALNNTLGSTPATVQNDIWLRESRLIDNWCTSAKSVAAKSSSILQGGVTKLPATPTKVSVTTFLQSEIDDVFAQMTAVEGSVLVSVSIVTRLAGAIDTAQKQLLAWQNQLTVAVQRGGSAVDSTLADLQVSVVMLPDDVRAGVEGAIDNWVPLAGVLVHAWDPLLEDVTSKAAGVLNQPFNSTSQLQSDFDAAVRSGLAALKGLLTAGGATTLGSTLAAIRSDLSSAGLAGNDVQNFLHDLLDTEHARVSTALADAIARTPLPDNDPSALSNGAKAIVQAIQNEANTSAQNICDTLHKVGQKVAQKVFNLLQSLIANASAEAIGFLNQLVTPVVAPATAALEAIRQQAEEALGRLGDALINSLPLPADQLRADASELLSVARALGTPPRVPNLSFSVPQMAYFMPPFVDAYTNRLLGMTPALSKVQQLGAALSPLSSGLPSLHLGDAIQLPDISRFKLGDLLPDFAGLKLSDLFPDVSITDSKKIRISRQFDAPTHTASVNVSITKLSLAGGGTLFSVGPVMLQVTDIFFDADVSMKSDGRGASRNASGQILGNWSLIVGGLKLVTFGSSTLSFDNSGHLHFSINPSRVELDPALGMVQAALKSFTSGSGFSLVTSPTGVLARYVLAVPNIGGATTGITNLTFGFQLGIEFAPFALTVGLNLGQSDLPFNVAIYVLGGSGYVGVAVRYEPEKGSISCSFTAELAASASFSLSLGPISGFVGVFLGISAQYSTGSRGGLRIGIFISVTGQASLLSIVTVYVQLRLDAFYQNGVFTGRASVSFRIKICWCFTLHVSASVQMSLGAGTQKARMIFPPPFQPKSLFVSEFSEDALPGLSPEQYMDFAKQYIHMLNED